MSNSDLQLIPKELGKKLERRVRDLMERVEVLEEWQKLNGTLKLFLVQRMDTIHPNQFESHVVAAASMEMAKAIAARCADGGDWPNANVY